MALALGELLAAAAIIHRRRPRLRFKGERSIRFRAIRLLCLCRGLFCAARSAAQRLHYAVAITAWDRAYMPKP